VSFGFGVLVGAVVGFTFVGAADGCDEGAEGAQRANWARNNTISAVKRGVCFMGFVSLVVLKVPRVTI
jgi:hypothetical protein